MCQSEKKNGKRLVALLCALTITVQTWPLGAVVGAASSYDVSLNLSSSTESVETVALEDLGFTPDQAETDDDTVCTATLENDTLKITAVGAGETTVRVKETADEPARAKDYSVIVTSDATAVVIDDNNNLPAAMTPDSVPPALHASTSPAATYCNDEIVWSVSDNASGVTIDPVSGALKFGAMTSDSEKITVTVQAGDVSDSYSFTLSRIAPTIAWPASINAEYGSSTELNIAPAGYTGELSFSVLDTTGNPSAAAEVVGNVLTIKQPNQTFKIKVDGTACGNYDLFTSTSNEYLTEAKTINVALQELTLDKQSDGTTALTPDNIFALNQALSEYVNVVKVGQDDIRISTDGAGAEYQLPASGFGTASVNDIPLMLSGSDSGNYTLETSVLSEVPANILPVAPEQGTNQIDLHANEAVSVHGATFTAKMVADEDGNYWLNGTENIVVSGSEVMTSDGGPITSITNTNSEIYIKDSDSKVYGPYAVTFERDTAAPVVSISGASENGLDLGKETVTYTLTVFDEASPGVAGGVGVQEVYYFVGASKPESTSQNWHAAALGGDPLGYRFDVTVPKSGQVFVKTVDKVGNENITESLRSIVLENNAPTVSLVCGDAAQYSQSHTIEVTAQDATSVGTEPYTYSGIQKIYYSLTRKGEDTPVVGFDRVEAFSSQRPQAMDDLPGLYQQRTEIFIQDTSLTGTYILNVWALDWCGNVSAEQAVELCFDNTAATLQVEITEGQFYDEADYHKNGFSVAFTVTDNQPFDVDNFSAIVMQAPDPSAVNFEAQQAEDQMSCVYVAHIAGDAAEGEYQFAISGQDAAGNLLAEKYQGGVSVNQGQNGVSGNNGTFYTRTKVLDVTAPEAVVTHVAPDEEHIYGLTSYHVQPVVVAVDFTDANSLDEDKLNYAFGAGELRTDDALIEKPAYQTLTNPIANGTTASGNMIIDEDGAYRLAVSGTDKAGNPVVVTEMRGDMVIAHDVSTETGAFESASNIVLDRQAPTATVTLAALEDEFVYGITSYYRQVPTVTLAVEDNGRTLDGTKIAYGISEAKSTPLDDESQKITGVYNEPDKTFNETENESLNQVMSIPSMDGAYQLRLKGEDKAGNKLIVTELRDNGNEELQPAASVGEGYFTTNNIVVDTTSPTFQLHIVPSDDVTNKEVMGDRYYFNGSFTARVTVDEANFDDTLVHVRRGQKNGSDYDASALELLTFDTEMSFAQEGFQDENVSGEGTYRYQISGIDKAGNALVAADGNTELDGTLTIDGVGDETAADLSYHITVDKTAPDGTLTVSTDKETFYKLLLKSGTVETSSPYRKEAKVDVAVAVDDLSPASILFSVSTVAGDPGDEIITDTSSYATTGTAEYRYRNTLACAVQDDRIFRITGIVLTDLAGNTTEYEKTNRIYLDGEEPVTDELAPNVDVNFGPVAEKKANSVDDYNGPKGNPLFNQDVPLRITVTDPYAGEKSSGLSEITYQMYINGNADAVDTVILREGSTTEWDENYDDPTLEFELDKLLTVDAEKHNYNDLRVVVTAKDNAGNTNVRELRFGIDITAPVIEISYDNNDALNGKYFNKDRIGTITVTERNFDPANISINTQSNQRSQWTRTEGTAANGDDDQWSCTVAYTADGSYTLEVGGSDLLGTDAKEITYSGTAPRDFVLDKTAPVVGISFDNNDVRNGKYYQQGRTATIQVSDVNFNGSNDITISATLGGVAPAVGFAGSAAVISFDVDGTYSFTGTVTDMAGNVSAPFTVDEFVIDQTAPSLTILGVEDGAAYPDEVLPEVVFSDQNYEGNTITLLHSGLDHINEDVSDIMLPEGGVATGEGGVASGNICFNDLEHIQENDGIYSLEVEISDLAGNATREQITYLVNRFGSVYVYSENLAAMVGQYQQKANDELYIMVYNVVPLKEGSAKLQITCDGTNVDGQMSTADTAASRQQTETGWNEYRFDIQAQDLAADGRYEIILSDMDEAGNIKTNAEEPAWFYIDTTKPSLDSVIGLEQAIINADSHTVSYTGSDAIALNSIKIYVDGKEVQSVDEFDGGSYEGSFVVGTGLRQNLRFVLVDKAGNVLDTDEDFKPAYVFNRQLTVSTNLLIRWFANTPLFVGSIASVVVLAGVGAFVLISKRHKKEEAKSV